MGLIANEGGNGLLKNVNVGLNEDLADVGISYRVLDGPRGWVDVLAGCRYTNLYQRATLYPNTRRINDASEKLVNDLSERLRDRLSDVRVSDDIKYLIAKGVLSRLQDLVGEHPALPIGPVGGSDLDQIKEEIKRLVQQADPGLVAAIKAEAEAATVAAKAAAQHKVNLLQTQLANAISSRLRSSLNQQVSKNNYWFDPYVGLRGQLILNKPFYLTGRIDIGGFDVGSQYTWEGYAAVGCHVTRYITSEIGYRCLYMNYRGGGLLYDAYTNGVEINTCITF